MSNLLLPVLSVGSRPSRVYWYGYWRGLNSMKPSLGNPVDRSQEHATSPTTTRVPRLFRAAQLHVIKQQCDAMGYLMETNELPEKALFRVERSSSATMLRITSVISSISLSITRV